MELKPCGGRKRSRYPIRGASMRAEHELREKVRLNREPINQRGGCVPCTSTEHWATRVRRRRSP